MHAAGLEISHTVPDKKPAEFDLVFDVKSDGWFNLISNIGTYASGRCGGLQLGGRSFRQRGADRLQFGQ